MLIGCSGHSGPATSSVTTQLGTRIVEDVWVGEGYRRREILTPELGVGLPGHERLLVGLTTDLLRQQLERKSEPR